MPGQLLIQALLPLLAIITFSAGQTCALQAIVQPSNPAATGAQSKRTQDRQNNAQSPP